MYGYITLHKGFMNLSSIFILCILGCLCDIDEL
jgi:hypothetical protein